MAESIEIAGSPTERRIGWLTLVLGLAATAVALAKGNRVWAGGLAVGTLLGWLNFRWLGRGADALAMASTEQHGQEKPLVPWWNYVLAVMRYALIGLTVYVIFRYRNIPLASMLIGLCALAIAAILASVWEIFVPVDR
jgi:hypothetical protein